MITREDINQFVSTSPADTKDMYELCSHPRDEKSKDLLASVVSKMLSEMFAKSASSLRKGRLVECVCNEYNVEELMAIATTYKRGRASSFWVRAMKAVGFSNLVLGVMGDRFGFDADVVIEWEKSDNQRYLDAGNGMFLAGLATLTDQAPKS